MKPSTGHYILNMLHKNIEVLRKKHPEIQIQIRWMPGHGESNKQMRRQKE
jgi:hypothetical protein